MNLRVVKLAFTNPALRRRILAVLLMLVIFRVLAHVPIPIAETSQLREFMQRILASNQLLGFANIFSGGAISQFSVAIMGLAPYINSSIIMQVMTQAVPKLKAIQKEGEQGRQKISQYTRMLTLPLAIGQSVAMVFLIRRLAQQFGEVGILANPPLTQWVLLITVMTGGSMLLMWLGELISEKGIGNGISLLIFASIIATFPTLFGQILALLKTDTGRIMTVTLFALGALVTTYFVVKLNEGQRKLTVSYAKRVRGSRQYGGVETELPVRVLTAGVIPIIFAVAFLAVPSFIGQLFASAQTGFLASLAQNLTVWFSPDHIVYGVTYFVLVVAFTYFYTGVVFNTRDIAENLQKQGGFIPGIRPGDQTARYLKKIVNRITLFGAISLGVLAVLPFIGQRLTGTTLLTFGGTSLLITVSVAIETLRQLEAQAIMSTYE